MLKLLDFAFGQVAFQTSPVPSMDSSPFGLEPHIMVPSGSINVFLSKDFFLPHPAQWNAGKPIDLGLCRC